MSDKVDTLPDFTSEELVEAIEWLRIQGFLSAEEERRPFEHFLEEAAQHEQPQKSKTTEETTPPLGRRPPLKGSGGR